MQTITKYRAYDGMEFADASDCLGYEAKCQAADSIIAQFPSLPAGCDFQNGGGYIQHDPAIFYKVRKELLIQAIKEHPHVHLKQTLEGQAVHPSYADRIINECCTKRLDYAWHRISCTDSFFREWGQPYYAAHPDRASGRDNRLN